MKFEGKNNVNTTWNTIVCGVVFINLLFFSHCTILARCGELLMSRFTFLFYFFFPSDFLLLYTVLYLYLD